jgi:hypothetical protein
MEIHERFIERGCAPAPAPAALLRYLTSPLTSPLQDPTSGHLSPTSAPTSGHLSPTSAPTSGHLSPSRPDLTYLSCCTLIRRLKCSSTNASFITSIIAHKSHEDMQTQTRPRKRLGNILNRACASIRGKKRLGNKLGTVPVYIGAKNV